jgi:hypothetical protein
MLSQEATWKKSEQAKQKWEQLSQSDGAEIYSLVALLDALGFRLAVTLK